MQVSVSISHHNEQQSMDVDRYTDLVGRPDVSWPERCSEVRGNQGKV